MSPARTNREAAEVARQCAMMSEPFRRAWLQGRLLHSPQEARRVLYLASRPLVDDLLAFAWLMGRTAATFDRTRRRIEEMLEDKP
jgi:hypothetical protein